MTADELLRIARAYAAAHGVTLTTVGRRACNNDKIFSRLARGDGCSSRSLAKAFAWFDEHWPASERDSNAERAA